MLAGRRRKAAAVAIAIGLVGLGVLWGMASHRVAHSPAAAVREPGTAGAGASLHITFERSSPRGAGTAHEVPISMPSGAVVYVDLRPLPPHYIGSDERLLDIYAKLEQTALAGDALASTHLHKMLEKCKGAHGDEPALRNALERLRQERILTLPGQPSRKVPDSVPLSKVEDELLRGPYEFCKGVTDEQKATSEKWLQMSVERGEFWALEAAAAKLRNSPGGVAAQEALWRRGHFSALPALTFFFERGVAGARSDYVRSYAYNYIQLLLMEAAYDSGKVSSQQLDGLRMSVRRSAGFLTAEQRKAAEALAEQLMRESPDCCVGF